MSKKETVEFESVTLKVPKKVMDYLKRMYGDPIKWIEDDIVDSIRADIDAMEPERIRKLFNLVPVFKTILGTDR